MKPSSAPSDAAANVTCDVVVAGAGPAGCATAIELARDGRRVLVVDKATFPRDKCCGDGLTTLALRELEQLGFDPSGVDAWYDVAAAWLRTPGGREIELPLPRRGSYAAVSPRRDFDHALVDLTQRSGVRVCERTAVRDVTVHDDHVDVAVATPDGPATITARYVVAADGMWSPVRKSLGLTTPGYRGEWHAFRQYVSNVTGPAADRLIVWFEPDLLPGYAWSFPLPGNRVNIGFGVVRDGERRVQDMAALWKDLLARQHVIDALGDGFRLDDRHLAWPIPARIDEMPLKHHRVLFVGDAAAASDVMTGEGIGQALLTGRLAAQAITRGGALQPDFVAAEYESLVRGELFADHRMARLLSGVLAGERGARWALRIVEHSGDWGRRNFARWMFEDEPRAIALTPTRWHQRLFDRDGTWA